MLTTFTQTAGQHGYPASTLTDNGMVYTVRFAGGKGGRSKLEHELRRLNIVQKNSRPNHPTTCGKVERFQQTMKKWLRAQPDQPTSLAELQVLLDRFTAYYNQRRPHRSLEHRATPAIAYQARPKAAPGADRAPETHDRVRTDKIDRVGTVTLRHNGHDCTTSASDEPTPEPTSGSSSRTSTSPSSTPPPARSSATSSSTPPATTSPPEHPKAPPGNDERTYVSVGPLSLMSCDITRSG